MVARIHKHRVNQTETKKKNSKKEKTRKEEQVALAEVVQKPPEVSVKVKKTADSAYAEMIALSEANEVALFKKKTIRYWYPLVWDPSTSVR